MVRSPSSSQVLSSLPGRSAVERKLILGYFSTSKKSGERRWPSRRSSRVVTLLTSSSTSADDCSGSSAITTLAVKSVKRPRTLAIMCRATNSNDEWAGSTAQVPAAGTVRPPTCRDAADGAAASVMASSSLEIEPIDTAKVERTTIYHVSAGSRK
jgi:hypothetical protein